MTLEPMFKRMARDFAEGNVAAVAAAFATPSVVYVGQKSLQLTCPEDIQNALGAYRKNLEVESYAETEFDISYQSPETNNRVQVLCNVTNRNERGAVISSFDASYILREDHDGRWRIVDHEILPPIASRLAAGIALV